MIIGAVVIGALCGLIPFFLGRRRGRAGLGLAGLISCIVGGFLLGIILALPLALIFAVIIAALPNLSDKAASRPYPPSGR